MQYPSQYPSMNGAMMHHRTSTDRTGPRRFRSPRLSDPTRSSRRWLRPASLALVLPLAVGLSGLGAFDPGTSAHAQPTGTEQGEGPARAAERLDPLVVRGPA